MRLFAANMRRSPIGLDPLRSGRQTRYGTVDYPVLEGGADRLVLATPGSTSAVAPEPHQQVLAPLLHSAAPPSPQFRPPSGLQRFP